MIEQERDFNPASFTRFANDAAPTSEFKIQDNPLEGPLALQAYVIEVEFVIDLANEVWTKAANGDIPIPVAGAMTNFEYQQLRYLSGLYGVRFGYY
jgi:hypothetical protein